MLVNYKKFDFEKKFSFIKKFGQLSFLRINCRVKTPKVKIVKFTAFQLMKFKTLSAKNFFLSLIEKRVSDKGHFRKFFR